MKATCAAALVSLFFFGAPRCNAQHGAMGGHGFGGSSGHAFGHFGGHRSGHSGGMHSGSRGSSKGRSEAPPLAGAIMDHGRVVELPNPGLHRPQPNHFHRPITEFGFRRHNGFGFALNSGFGFCGFFGGLGTHNVFGDDFSCLSFFFDPFFAGGVPTPSGDDSTTQGSEQDQPIAADASAEDAPQDVMVEDDPPKPVDRVPHHRRSPREPDTLLQLKDGSMYGLRDYWEEGGRLYYLTNYGGGNSVPLAQIDLPRTQQLNAERGEKFVLAPAPVD